MLFAAAHTQGTAVDQHVKESIDRAKAMHKLYGYMTPDYVATLAYNAHAASADGQNNPITKETASKEVEHFTSLPSSLDSAAGLFLHKVRIEFVSLANAISRCKRDLTTQMAEISEQYSPQESKLNRQWFSRGTWKALNRFAAMTGFAATGAAIARALIPVFSSETAAHTGYGLPTAGATLIAGWVGYCLFEWWNEHQRTKVGDAKRHRKRNARKENDEERLHQIKRHLERLHAIWYEYVGVEYWIPVDDSYARLIREDMEISEQLDREFEQRTAPLATFVRKCAERLSKRARSASLTSTSPTSA